MVECDYTEEELIEELIQELRPLPWQVVIVNHIVRSSTSYYNYQTVELIIIAPTSDVPYEESDVKNIIIRNVYTGVYQCVSDYELEKALEKLEEDGYQITYVSI